MISDFSDIDQKCLSVCPSCENMLMLKIREVPKYAKLRIA